MDAIKVLTSDHDTVRDLFEKFRKAKDSGDEATMKSLRDEIFEELETHSRIEEDVFYPSAKDTDDEEVGELVAEGVQEHHVVKTLMREVEEISSQETFEAKMTVLIENVEHHAEEEEDELFPKLRSQMSDAELEDLGQQLEAAKS